MVHGRCFFLWHHCEVVEWGAVSVAVVGGLDPQVNFRVVVPGEAVLWCCLFPVCGGFGCESVS